MVVRPSLVPVLGLVLLLGLLGLGGCRGESDAVPFGAGPDARRLGPVNDAPAEPRALRVLHAWDARRAAAYSRGDVRGVRRLYVEGSRAGERDARLLRSYAARGLVVGDLRMQVLGVDVLRAEAGMVRVRVRERVASGRVLRARGAGPGVELPRDGTDVRVVTLVRSDTGWRVRAVTAP